MPRRGFTVVELLVVVAIVGLLIGVLVPTLSAARATAQASACLANMRTMSTASLAYSSDHGGDLIDVGLPHGSAGVASNEAGSFITTLSGYTKTSIARHCPTDKSALWPIEEGGDVDIHVQPPPTYRKTSYGMSNFLSAAFPFPDPDHPPAREVFHAREGETSYKRDRVSKPSLVIQFLEMTDDGDYATSDHVHLEDLYNPGLAPDYYPIVAATMMKIDRHGGRAPTGVNAQPTPKAAESKANYTFLDGSARTLPFKEAFASPTVNMFDPRLTQR